MHWSGEAPSVASEPWITYHLPRHVRRDGAQHGAGDGPWRAVRWCATATPARFSHGDKERHTVIIRHSTPSARAADVGWRPPKEGAGATICHGLKKLCYSTIPRWEGRSSSRIHFAGEWRPRRCLPWGPGARVHGIGVVADVEKEEGAQGEKRRDVPFF